MADLQTPPDVHLFLLIQTSNVYKAFGIHHTLFSRPLSFSCQATCQSKNTEKLSLISLLLLL